MNTGYYQTLYSQLASMKNSLPADMEASERSAVLSRIAAIQQYCLVQMQEILDYESRHADV